MTAAGTPTPKQLAKEEGVQAAQDGLSAPSASAASHGRWLLHWLPGAAPSVRPTAHHSQSRDSLHGQNSDSEQHSLLGREMIQPCCSTEISFWCANLQGLQPALHSLLLAGGLAVLGGQDRPLPQRHPPACRQMWPPAGRCAKAGAAAAQRRTPPARAGEGPAPAQPCAI